MSFRNRPYARRPTMNPVPVGGSSSNDDVDKRKYCPRCSFNLYYMEEKDIFFCGKCAWNMPDEYSKKNQEEQKEQEQVATKKGSATTTADATNKEEDIHIVSKGTRSQEKKKDKLDYLRRDDAYMQKSGLNFVSEVIDLPTGDKEVVSSEDLKRDKIRLRMKSGDE